MSNIKELWNSCSKETKLWNPCNIMKTYHRGFFSSPLILGHTLKKKIKGTYKSLDYSFWHRIYECTFEAWALLFFYSQCACHFKRLYIHRKWNSVHRQYPYGLFNIKSVLESWMSSWSFCHSWIKNSHLPLSAASGFQEYS